MGLACEETGIRGLAITRAPISEPRSQPWRRTSEFQWWLAVKPGAIRDGSYPAFKSILRDAGGLHIDVKTFWEHWEERNIAHYWQPYRRYRDICEQSLADTFEHYRLTGTSNLISRYFDSFSTLRLYPDVEPTLERLASRYRLALVSNIDDDLLAMTPLRREFDLVCTAERAQGYKPDGTLFRYLMANAGCSPEEILHSGQSQFTDLVGAKPLGLMVAWINRRSVTLERRVPRPDFVLSDIASLLTLVEMRVQETLP